MGEWSTIYRLCWYCQKAYIENDEDLCQPCHSKNAPDDNEWFELMHLGITYEEIEAYLEKSNTVNTDWKRADRLAAFIENTTKGKEGPK